MNLSRKFLAQMHAATRSMMRRSPAVTRSVMRASIKNAKALQQQASNQGWFDPTDMLAHLGRTGQDAAHPAADPFDAPSSGAAAAGLPGRFIDASFANDAGARDYKLYVPSTYGGQPSPLLVMLHGCTQHPDDFALGTGMNQVAEEVGCLVAYPAQSAQANASRCWNWFNAVEQRRGQGEPSILVGLTRAVMANYTVDPARVYVAGLSAGGAMAAILGTLYPELYAAVGVHSGLPFAAAHDLPSALAAMKGDARRGVKRRAAPDQAVRVIVFHGDRDTTVHPANGDDLIRHRRRHANEDVAVEPGRVPDGHAYTRTVHRHPDGGIDAEHWVVHGAGHAWSGGDARGSYTDARGPNASRAMMRFFRTQR